MNLSGARSEDSAETVLRAVIRASPSVLDARGVRIHDRRFRVRPPRLRSSGSTPEEALGWRGESACGVHIGRAFWYGFCRGYACILGGPCRLVRVHRLESRGPHVVGADPGAAAP